MCICHEIISSQINTTRYNLLLSTINVRRPNGTLLQSCPFMFLCVMAAVKARYGLTRQTAAASLQRWRRSSQRSWRHYITGCYAFIVTPKLDMTCILWRSVNKVSDLCVCCLFFSPPLIIGFSSLVLFLRRVRCFTSLESN